MSTLSPATDLPASASKPYPNDDAECRQAGTALLAEEIDLRRHIERVAAQRRCGTSPTSHRQAAAATGTRI